jgi:cysteine-rich repeat protein
MNLKPLALILLLLGGTVFAQNFTTSSSQANPAGFLSTSADAQSRQGWMGIGAPSAFSNGPAAPVDVRGLITAADSLQVLGNMFIANKAAIGGTLPSGDGLKISGGTIRIAGLSYTPATAGSVKKRLCLNPLGKVVTCTTGDDTAVRDLCTNITGYQLALPYTYYEQGTGQKVVVNDPNTDGVCTRIDIVCSDGIDNDNDGYIDAADGNCYDNVIAGGTPPNGHTVVNKQSAPLSGNNIIAGVFTAAINSPTIKIGDRYFVYNPYKTSEVDIQSQVCRNGTVESPEECDDGNTSNTDACINSCVHAVCRDGYVRAGVEQCDDGNTSNTDACINNCTNAFCGDFYVRAGVEQCDNGTGNSNSGSAACSTSCTWRSWCGDGVVQTPNSNGGNEQCDLGSSNGASGGTCSSSCTISKVFVRITSNHGNGWYSSGASSPSGVYISNSGSGWPTLNSGGTTSGGSTCSGDNASLQWQRISFYQNSAGTVPINISTIPGGITVHYRTKCDNFSGGNYYNDCPTGAGTYNVWSSSSQYIGSGTTMNLEEDLEYTSLQPEINGGTWCGSDIWGYVTEVLDGTSLSTLKYEII